MKIRLKNVVDTRNGKIYSDVIVDANKEKWFVPLNSENTLQEESENDIIPEE